MTLPPVSGVPRLGLSRPLRRRRRRSVGYQTRALTPRSVRSMCSWRLAVLALPATGYGAASCSRPRPAGRCPELVACAWWSQWANAVLNSSAGCARIQKANQRWLFALGGRRSTAPRSALQLEALYRFVVVTLEAGIANCSHFASLGLAVGRRAPASQLE